jgi:hypothetical protein
MASNHLTAGNLQSTPAVEHYLAELATRLLGPRAARTRVLTEIRDGLTEAIDARLADGMPPAAAAATAIGEFGDPTTVAHSFDAELATAFARRTIAMFIITGPLVGIWWLLLLHAAPWRTGFLATVIAIPALPLIALAIVTAAGTFATTGRLMRWLPETSANRALAAATIIATLCVAGDLTVLGVLTLHLATGWHHSVPLMTVAATASILRIAAAIAAIRATKAAGDRLRHMLAPQRTSSASH